MREELFMKGEESHEVDDDEHTGSGHVGAVNMKDKVEHGDSEVGFERVRGTPRVTCVGPGGKKCVCTDGKGPNIRK